MPEIAVLRLPNAMPPAEDFGAAVHSFLSYCKARNLSPQTIEYYRYRLAAFGSFLDANAPSSAPGAVTPQTVREFAAWEAKTKSPSTANHSILTLKVFFSYLVDEGFLAANPMAKVEKLRRKTTIIETFTMAHIDAILAVCDKGFSGVRDSAIILLLLDSGLRVSELCALDLDDVDWSEQTVTVLGKGSRERCVPFGQTCKAALMQYVGRRGSQSSPALFISCYGDRLDRYRVREIIVGRCRQAGITGVRCSPHTFRHTFAVHYLRNGGDAFSLQKLLGHADLTMTRRYCELAQNDIVEKHRQFSPGDRVNPKAITGRKRIR